MTGEAKVSTQGWPVLVAFRLSKMEDITLQLGISQSNRTHTNLTLTYIGEQNGALQMELTVESSVMPRSKTLLVLVTPDSWNTLKVNLHRNKLVVVVVGHSASVNYTTRSLVDFPHHRGVDAVTSTCHGVCLIDVDLQCLYDAVEGSAVPAGHTNVSGNKKEKKHPGPTSWPLLLVLVLLALVFVLILTWRYQRRQIKRRRRLQAEEEAKRKRLSQGGSPGQRENGIASGGLDGRRGSGQEARIWDEGRVHYSTVLVGYDGPYTGGDEDDFLATADPKRENWL